jgi:hypothetical protein
MLSSIAGYM